MLIYLATNRINGKVYVGKTLRNIPNRRSVHRAHAHGSSRSNRSYFHSAIRKYGIEAFEFRELQKAKDAQELSELERTWIERLRSNDSKFGYNLTAGGEGTPGFHHSEETREKISAANKGNRNTFGRKKSKEEIERQRVSAKKFWAIEENRKRQSERMMGHPVSEEARRKFSINAKRQMTPEMRQRLSRASIPISSLGSLTRKKAKSGRVFTPDK